MKLLKRILIGVTALIVILGTALFLWYRTLGKDNGPDDRPAYGSYTWTNADPPRGGPKPRSDGYVVGSQGNAFILPPMPPARPMDIHRADTVTKNNSIKNCFWPGPKLRPGFYTTDPDDYGIENQLPDTMNTFGTAWFRIPAGARLVLTGEFPHMRHWSFTTYTEDGVPRDKIDDDQIDPEPGSFNPFREGVRRDAAPRRYSFSIYNGNPPDQRPANSLYTLAPPDTPIGMHMRNYVPDRSTDWLGGVALPEVDLVFDDGRVLQGEEACAATIAPLRGKQVPLALNPAMWQAMTRLPWVDEGAPAVPFESASMEMFFNREYVVMKHFFSVFDTTGFAVQKGGFWSNLSTRYGYKFINQRFGKVYAIRGKMPAFPKTWSGDGGPLDRKADMRYWSVCTTAAPPTGMTVDCLFDEEVLPTLDVNGWFTIVVSRAPDRPANATKACGVAWMEWGNGDGIPGGSPDYGSIINRHTGVNPDFKHSWFAVTEPNAEREVMGEYLPYVLNLHDRAMFESLGCPVDKSKLSAMIQR